MSISGYDKLAHPMRRAAWAFLSAHIDNEAVRYKGIHDVEYSRSGFTSQSTVSVRRLLRRMSGLHWTTGHVLQRPGQGYSNPWLKCHPEAGQQAGSHQRCSHPNCIWPLAVGWKF